MTKSNYTIISNTRGFPCGLQLLIVFWRVIRIGPIRSGVLCSLGNSIGENKGRVTNQVQTVQARDWSIAHPLLCGFAKITFYFSVFSACALVHE